MTVGIGSRVRVPVRTRLVLATVVELMDETEAQGVKPIAEVLSAKPLISPVLIQLGHWVASYYCCALHIALRAILPQVVRNAEVKEKLLLFARLSQKPDLAALKQMTKRAPKQAGVIDFLMGVSDPIAVTELMKECGVTRSTLDLMRDHGLIALERQAVQRDPYREEVFVHAPQLEMNVEQCAAFERIAGCCEGAGASSADSSPRRDRKRKDGALSAGHGPCAQPRQDGDRARAGDFADTPDRRAFQEPVCAFARGGGRIAQPPLRRRAPRRMAQDQ